MLPLASRATDAMTRPSAKRRFTPLVQRPDRAAAARTALPRCPASRCPCSVEFTTAASTRLPQRQPLASRCPAVSCESARLQRSGPRETAAEHARHRANGEVFGHGTACSSVPAAGRRTKYRRMEWEERRVVFFARLPPATLRPFRNPPLSVPTAGLVLNVQDE